MSVEFSRRFFLVASALAGGGMALGPSPALAGPGEAAELGPWLTIGPDGAVTVRVTTPEIGNGVISSAARLVAEELGCDWSMVRTQYVQPRMDKAYSTGGVMAWFSGRTTGADRIKMLRLAGASARERLRAAAAARWNVPAAEVEAKGGLLRHAATGRTLGFGAVASEAATVALALEPVLQPCAPFLPGKRIEQAAIVGGHATYGIDVAVPGMVYAALRQVPTHGGTLRSLDADKVRSMPGVLAVVTVDPSEPRGLEANGKPPMAFPFFTTAPQAAVAVIAEHYWQARTALDALPVEWDEGAGAAWRDDAQVAKAAEALLGTPSPKPLFEAGKPEEIEGKRVRADYRAPYADHVQMEPLNGTARVTDGAVELWMPTQNIQQSVWVAADEARVPLDHVTHHQPLIGGAFGRRTMADDTRMVVAVARKFPGRPVKLIWSREECVRQGRYRPYAAARMEAVLGDDGSPKALTARVAQARGFPPIGLADSPFLRGGAIPNVRVEAQPLDMHLLTGSFRGPSYSSYAFMIESFIDECAVAAGVSPLDYRLKLLADWPDPGWASALKFAAEKASFGKTLPKGQGQGIAVGNWGGYGRPRHGTTAAAVAEVAVSRKGELTVRRIDVAFDSGRVLDADLVRQQLTGATLFGLNVALNEALSIKDGQIVEGNYDAYPVRRMADTPDIHIHFDALSGDDRYGEIGEVGVGPVSAAVASAIFRATGKRLRTQPFRLHDLSWT